MPALFADPTYSCLLTAVPLMDVHRRDCKRIRTTLTVGILAIVTVLLLTEDTPRSAAEIEAMIGVGIAFMIITMLGDAFRQLDHGFVMRAELADVNERMRLVDVHVIMMSSISSFNLRTTESFKKLYRTSFVTPLKLERR